MTELGDDASRLAAGQGGPCFSCGGTGGHPMLQCSGCGGTGRVSRPGPPWLSVWQSGTAMPELASALIGVGLGAQDERTMVAAALADGSGPVCHVSEGPAITWLGDRPLGHYDMTGQCQSQHPHVAWDAASANIDEITPAAQQLAYAAIDPAGAWKPPDNIEPGNLAGYINPAMWKTLPVIALALWTAGASGQGTRAAMEWLAGGQLANMLAFCRPLAERMGRPSMPLLSATAELLAGPQPELQTAIRLAWQSMAPVEEAIRVAPQAQRLDLRSWLAGSGMLAVSLPPGSENVHRQVVAAMLVAAADVARLNGLPADPTVIWYHVDAPHGSGGAADITGLRWLVLAGSGAGFASWTARDAPNARLLPAWLLGEMTDPGTRAAASRRLKVDVPAPSAGQALLVHSGGPPVMLARTTS
jgi:hypothetical protein